MPGQRLHSKPMPSHAPAGRLLRHYRQARGLSQLSLSGMADVSTRHISYVENGKAKPSREMLLTLSAALELPLRERNTLLVSAGFAPVYGETPLEAPEMAHVRAAAQCILDSLEPNGAVLLGGQWQVLQVNAGAMRMLTTFCPDATNLPELGTSLMRLLFDPKGLKPCIANWDEVVRHIVHRLQRDAAAESERGVARRALADVLTYPGVPHALRQPMLSTPPELVIPVHLRRGDLEIRLFTTLTTLGTPLDITTEEIRIESYFPADEASRRWVHADA